MRTIEVKDLAYLPLGRQGETKAQKVVWTGIADSWARLYGAGVFALTVKRQGDTMPYPASITSENGDVVWVLGSADTARAGEGLAELTYTVDGAVAKSRTWRTVTEPSLSAAGTTEPPPAYQSWVDEVLKAGASAETAVSKMPYVDETTGNWFKWDAAQNAFTDTGVAATGPKGETGPKGDKGEQGKRGMQGERGPVGATGATGARGEAGPKGETGAAGPRGEQGEKGEKGDPFTYSDFTAAQLEGLRGEQGPVGPKGETGATGATGARGEKGDTGDTGPIGPQGPRGEQGIQGEQGPRGETGKGLTVLSYYESKAELDAAQKATAKAGDAYGVGTAEPYDIYIFDGITGEFINNGPLQGAKGETGERGPQGIQGPKGDPGKDGAKGADGLPGKDGADGAPGKDGTNGRDGVTFTPAMSAAGDLSWTNDGGLANPETVNLKGPKGDTGPKGDPGAKGDPGERGADGAPGKDGAKGADGLPGKDGADGKTPVKGVDYFTAAEVEQVAQEAAGKVNGSDIKVTFTPASTRTALESGTKLAILMGKIAKWLNDLGWLAFKDTVTTNDVSAGIKASLSRADSALQSVSKSDVGLGNVANERQYSSANPPPYPVTSVNGKTGAVTVSAPTVPATTSLIKGNGSGGLAAATAGTDYALRPTTRKVTLTASGWNSSTKQQTVTCSGVLSDATKQLLIPTPVNTAAGNPYDEASIQMVAQGANSVTFYADTVPTESIDVYVTIYPINYLG